MPGGDGGRTAAAPPTTGRTAQRLGFGGPVAAQANPEHGPAGGRGAARPGVVLLVLGGKGPRSAAEWPLRPGNEVFALRRRTGTGRCPVVVRLRLAFSALGLVLVAPKPSFPPLALPWFRLLSPLPVRSKSSGGVQPGLGSYTPCSSGPDNERTFSGPDVSRVCPATLSKELRSNTRITPPFLRSVFAAT